LPNYILYENKGLYNYFAVFHVKTGAWVRRSYQKARNLDELRITVMNAYGNS
jgi:hypothetical protein